MRVGVLEVPNRRISTAKLLSDRKLTLLRLTLDPKCRPPLQKGKVLCIRLTGRPVLGTMSPPFQDWKNYCNHPRLRNNLPQHVRDAESLDIFKRQLKTVLFKRAF